MQTQIRTAKMFLMLALPLVFAAVSASAADDRTSLTIKNGTDQSVTVGVILAALGGACPLGHPPVTADQLSGAGFCQDVIDSANPPYAGKCTLTLDANGEKTFPSFDNTCLSGNVTFGGYASCPGGAFPEGTTTAEFTLNPQDGFEVVDISLVNGYSDKVEISMQGGAEWSDSVETVKQIVSKPLGMNVGNPGVYPKNCTICTALSGSPVCPGFSPTPTCQSSAICNVQRGTYGGKVTITLHPSLM